MATTLVSQTLAKIDIVELDASVKEEHKASVEVTDHAVETGIAVTDHARPKPEEVTIEGIVTNTPLLDGQAQRAQGNNYARGASGLGDAAYLALIDLHDNPRLITIVTGLRSYTDMMLTELKVPRDAKTGECLHFEATFKKVRRVTNATTVVATKQPKAKKKVNAGAKPTAAAPSVSNNYAAIKAQAVAAATGGGAGGGHH